MTDTGNRPNIVLILADDMGFSDIGCFGSEIDTPNLDSLAEHGIRFSQMYNGARCCPTRASLLTGLAPHQAGVGHMVNDRGVPGYEGYLNDSCVTIAEALSATGYRTYLSGKWHVGGGYQGNLPDTWHPGRPGFPIPVQRGFDEHYGMLGGGGSYFHPPYMIHNDKLIDPGSEAGYYLTDAISEQASRMIAESAAGDGPFFLYAPYTAPHWPLHAFEEDIEKYRGRYQSGGWDALRCARHEELKGLGILDHRWDISPRDAQSRPWSDVRDKEWEDLRMAVYAAQIDRLDQGIGRIITTLKEQGEYENTIIFFLSDNGGCAEFLAEESNLKQPFRYDTPTPDGRSIQIGNTPEINPGPDDTFASYDLPWANASNAPFRLYKHWVHEGGISTPFIAHWPKATPDDAAGGIVHSPTHITDITATCLAAAGAVYPRERSGKTIPPIEGESLLDALCGKQWQREKPIIIEHEGNCAVRDGEWKLVKRYPEEWELYNMVDDRTELNDLAATEHRRVEGMTNTYDAWAERCRVVPWERFER
jgi:arylsulfatase A-like enzyme